MPIKISTRHGNLSEKTQEAIRAKLEKFNRLFERLTAIELMVNLEKADQPKVDLLVSAAPKHNFVADYCSEDLFGCVDQVIHKVEQQLRKFKGKRQNHSVPSSPEAGEIE